MRRRRRRRRRTLPPSLPFLDLRNSGETW